MRALAKAISATENAPETTAALMKLIYPKTAKAAILGVTGSPGAGKSALVDKMASLYRGEGRSVAVVAVDPSSSFSGGAILGDRVRMQRLSSDPGIFIRSMATRGCVGGLARATADAIDIIDAFGFEIILVETVGVGQNEIDIVKLAHTIALVLTPTMGDEIQAIKAGIMEIADVFVINKSDLAGADELRINLKTLIDYAGAGEKKDIPIVKTVATTGSGVEQLVETISRKGEEDEPRLKRKREEIAGHRFFTLLRDKTVSYLESELLAGDEIKEYIGKIVRRDQDPHSAVEEVLEKFRAGSKS